MDEVPRLHLPSMIAAGEVVSGEVIRTNLIWSTADGQRMRMAIVAEMKADRGQLVMQPAVGRCYLVEVVSASQPFGGRRWWLVCPVAGRRTSTLYLPPGAVRFASREAHGLTYRTQRLGAEARASAREEAG